MSGVGSTEPPGSGGAGFAGAGAGMSRQHERMLAEGPRVAPEPRTVDAYDPGTGRLVVREPGSGDVGTASGGGISIGRALVPVLFVAFFVAQFAQLGAVAWVFLLAAILLGSVFGERGGKAGA